MEALGPERLVRESFSLEDDVVAPFLQTNGERAVASGADHVIAALAHHVEHDAPHSSGTGIARRIDSLNGDAGERPAIAINHLSAEGHASRNRDGDAAFALARIQTQRCASAGREAFLRRVDLQIAFRREFLDHLLLLVFGTIRLGKLLRSRRVDPD